MLAVYFCNISIAIIISIKGGTFMRQKHEVGSLIRKGLNSEEIRERVKDFPDNPDIQYFINLGYTTSTAKNYRILVRKNNSEKLGSNTTSLIASKNADKHHLLLDTSALTSTETVDIIELASSITLLYSIIKEFDIAPKKENASPYFRKMVKQITKSILSQDNNSKYRLIPFERNVDKYTDEILLDYLLSLPSSERPTLLTCDANLALKAKCLSLEFILCSVVSTDKKEVTITPTTEEPAKLESSQIIKNDNLNINLLYEDLINTQKYSPQSLIFFIKGKTCNKITQVPSSVSIDYCCIVTKSYDKEFVKIKKYYLQNGQKATMKFRCYCEEDAKNLQDELHPSVLTCVKELLYSKEEPS